MFLKCVKYMSATYICPSCVRIVLVVSDVPEHLQDLLCLTSLTPALVLPESVWVFLVNLSEVSWTSGGFRTLVSLYSPPAQDALCPAYLTLLVCVSSQLCLLLP